MNRTAKIIAFLFEEMPMPEGTVLLGDAGFPRETDYAIVVRRNLTLDVSRRLPASIQPFPQIGGNLQASLYYLNFSRGLMDDLQAIVARVCPDLSHTVELSHEPGEDTRYYFGEAGSLAIRSKFCEWKSGATLWDIDLIAHVVNHEKA